MMFIKINELNDHAAVRNLAKKWYSYVKNVFKATPACCTMNF